MIVFGVIGRRILRRAERGAVSAGEGAEIIIESVILFKR
jgi:hypothetical protein